MTPEEYKQTLPEEDNDEQEIQDLETQYLVDEKIKPVEFKKVNSKCKFNVLTMYSRSLWERERRVCFFINKELKLKGKVTNQLFPYKQKITLLRVGVRNTDDGEVEKLLFLHEPPEKKWRVKKNIDVEFYIYTMIANGKRYLLFNEEELGSEEYIIEGSLIEPQDYADLGHSFKITTKLPMLFVSKAYPRVQKINSHEELFKLSKKYDLDEDRLNNYIFSSKEPAFKGKSLRHPDYFEKLMDALLFSGKEDGYPLHFLMLAQPGTGKTKLEECLHNKFKEQSIVEGSGSTIKSLIPSFKENIPKVGSLIESNRICVIDEFLRILVRIRKDEREHQLAMLNSLLEHSARSYNSGNSSVNGQATSKMFTVSNEVYHTNSMANLVETIDRSFISRLFVWYQDAEHIQYIQDKAGLQSTYCKIDDNDWLAIYDYMNNFRAKYDKERVANLGKIYSKIIGKFNGYVAEVFDARYKTHHINLILDGIVKTRCLCEQDISFTANEKDYKDLEIIFTKLVEGWTKNTVLITKEDVKNE